MLIITDKKRNTNCKYSILFIQILNITGDITVSTSKINGETLKKKKIIEFIFVFSI